MMSSQESTTTSLYSDLFRDENLADYEPVGIDFIRKETEKCLEYAGEIPNLEEESDISIGVDSSSGSDSEEEPSLSSFDQSEEQIWRNETKNLEIPAFRPPTGPSHSLENDATPLDFFTLYWDGNLLKMIVEETNR